MSLRDGQRLGPYEIREPLGAGGMGEVYRAFDARLGREVAVKILPERLAGEPALLARFEREARVLAALSHPGIAVIHDVGEATGAGGARLHYLVTELVPGETLAELIARGPVPPGKALDIARQIASALAAAHERGVVHRDLKPANVKVAQDGRVRVLDFGLATPLEPAGTGSTAGSEANEAATTQARTLTRAVTRAGAVLGTPLYMSPEQARGAAADRRSDIWSLGCVLYELVAGRLAFDGPTVPDVLVSVLTREPDWKALPPDAPLALRRLLERCLDKDVERRPGDAEEVLGALDRIAAAGSERARGRGGRWRLAAGVAALVAVAALLLARRGERVDGRAAPHLSPLTTSEGVESAPVFSPDGRSVAFVSESAGLRSIVLKRLDDGSERRLPGGSFDNLQPAFAPDGRRLAFVRGSEPGRKLEPGDVFGMFTEGDVWVVELETGKQTRLLQEAFNPSFSPDGASLAVDASWAGPRRVWVADAQGRNPRQLTSDASEAATHLRPRWSPDGRRLVFQRLERTRFDVRVVELDGQRTTPLTDDHLIDIHPVFAPSGRHVYFSSPRGGGLNVWRVPVSAQGEPDGRLEQVTTGAGQDVDPAFSPDGRRLAFATLGQNADLWRLPLSEGSAAAAGKPERLVATTREDSRGSFSPDGKQVAFNSDRSGDMNIWLRSLGDGSERALTSGPGGDFQPRWSPDGRSVVFFSSREGSADIWSADVASGRLARLTTSRATEANPCYSPDGERIAFQSDEGGRLELWIMRRDGGEPRALTRTGVGGHFLGFTRDGRSVVYPLPGGGGRLMTVPAAGGEPVALAEVAGGSHISFTPDSAGVVDVVGHQALWLTRLSDGRRTQLFAFPDPRDRIDYPVLSPDGRSVLFDLFRPSGGDIWLLEGF